MFLLTEMSTSEQCWLSHNSTHTVSLTLIDFALIYIITDGTIIGKKMVIPEVLVLLDSHQRPEEWPQVALPVSHRDERRTVFQADELC